MPTLTEGRDGSARRALGLDSATAVVVGGIIGVGIFLTPAEMALALGSPFRILVVWLGVGLTVFVSIRTNQHNESWLERFASGVRKIPEVVELYRMSGDTDYLLKVLARDVADYDRIYKRLIRVAELHDVSSSFAMEQIKYTTEVPLTGLEEQ